MQQLCLTKGLLSRAAKSLLPVQLSSFGRLWLEQVCEEQQQKNDDEKSMPYRVSALWKAGPVLQQNGVEK